MYVSARALAVVMMTQYDKSALLPAPVTAALDALRASDVTSVVGRWETYVNAVLHADLSDVALEECIDAAAAISTGTTLPRMAALRGIAQLQSMQVHDNVKVSAALVARGFGAPSSCADSATSRDDAAPENGSEVCRGWTFSASAGLWREHMTTIVELDSDYEPTSVLPSADVALASVHLGRHLQQRSIERFQPSPIDTWLTLDALVGLGGRSFEGGAEAAVCATLQLASGAQCVAEGWPDQRGRTCTAPGLALVCAARAVHRNLNFERASGRTTTPWCQAEAQADAEAVCRRCSSWLAEGIPLSAAGGLLRWDPGGPWLRHLSKAVCISSDCFRALQTLRETTAPWVGESAAADRREECSPRCREAVDGAQRLWLQCFQAICSALREVVLRATVAAYGAPAAAVSPVRRPVVGASRSSAAGAPEAAVRRTNAPPPRSSGCLRCLRSCFKSATVEPLPQVEPTSTPAAAPVVVSGGVSKPAPPAPIGTPPVQAPVAMERAAATSIPTPSACVPAPSPCIVPGCVHFPAGFPISGCMLTTEPDVAQLAAVAPPSQRLCAVLNSTMSPLCRLLQRAPPSIADALLTVATTTLAAALTQRAHGTCPLVALHAVVEGVVLAHTASSPEIGPATQTGLCGVALKSVPEQAPPLVLSPPCQSTMHVAGGDQQLLADLRFLQIWFGSGCPLLQRTAAPRVPALVTLSTAGLLAPASTPSQATLVPGATAARPHALSSVSDATLSAGGPASSKPTRAARPGTSAGAEARPAVQSAAARLPPRNLATSAGVVGRPQALSGQLNGTTGGLQPGKANASSSEDSPLTLPTSAADCLLLRLLFLRAAAADGSSSALPTSLTRHVATSTDLAPLLRGQARCGFGRDARSAAGTCVLLALDRWSSRGHASAGATSTNAEAAALLSFFPIRLVLLSGDAVEQVEQATPSAGLPPRQLSVIPVAAESTGAIVAVAVARGRPATAAGQSARPSASAISLPLAPERTPSPSVTADAERMGLVRAAPAAACGPHVAPKPHAGAEGEAYAGSGGESQTCHDTGHVSTMRWRVELVLGDSG